MYMHVYKHMYVPAYMYIVCSLGIPFNSKEIKEKSHYTELVFIRQLG